MAFPTFIKDENDMEFGQECPIFPPNCRYKVASVTINGRSITALLTEDEELLCFPQLVDYFLKDHVAGMPTIYAKVKRMGIVARSCNLDQVRLMRSMGAIGPVVNRCKLITMEDFKRLYEDCLLFRGPGRRKRVSAETTHTGTPIKISIKRPYLEENDENDEHFAQGRKVEEEMIVNVSSPISNDSCYFSELHDKSNHINDGAFVMRRPNGFSNADDKFGFPSMIYSTFSHTPNHSAVSLPAHSFDTARLTALPSPKTTLIQPINGEMSPALEEDNAEPSPVLTPTSDAAAAHSAGDTMQHAQTTTVTSPNAVSLQTSVYLHPSSSVPTTTTSTDHAKTTSNREVIRSPSTNVIFTHVSSAGYTPRCSNRSTTQAGVPPPVMSQRHHRQQRERMTSSETLIANIQGLLKVTSDNVRMVERQIMVDKDEFTREFQKECEARIKAEKMITELQKDKSILQKKLRRAKKANRKLTNQCQASEQRCATLTNELQGSSFGALRQQNELLETELEKERLNRIDAEKKLEEARGGIQNFVHNFFENSEGNTEVMSAPLSETM